MPKLLIVEDDEKLLGRLCDYLGRQQFTIDCATNAADAVQLLNSFTFDLLLLDWQLPDGSGADLCARYRKAGGTAPVIFLTGQSDIDHKQAGFESGADDYLTKPFHELELLMRLRALLRRSTDVTPDVLCTGNVLLDVRSCSFLVNNISISLRPKEYKLMECFLRNVGNYLSIDALRDRAWKSDNPPDDHAVRQWIHRLRQTLSAANATVEIQSSPGIGYRLISIEAVG